MIKEIFTIALLSAITACGSVVDEPQEETSTPKVDCPSMNPTGDWIVHSTWMTGNCGPMPPYLVAVDNEGQLYIEQSDCVVIKRMLVEHRCQQVTMVKCESIENNLKASMHFFLKREYDEFANEIWKGNINVSISAYDTDAFLCESVYDAVVLPY